MRRYASLIGLLLLLLPGTADAILPVTPCAGLVGCGGGAANVLLNNASRVADLLMQMAIAFSVLFIVWSGFQMIIAIGDESKISQARWGVLYSLLGLGLAGVSQIIVSTVGTYAFNIANPILPVGLVGSAIDILLTLTNVALIIAVIIGGIRMVYAQGKSDEFNKGKTTILWAASGAVFINLANALVQALAGFLGI